MKEESPNMYQPLLAQVFLAQPSWLLHMDNTEYIIANSLCVFDQPFIAVKLCLQECI
jgi:hypothetical protein